MSYVAASIVDKGLIIIVVFLIMRLMPDSLAKALSIENHIPAAVFVNAEGEAEFEPAREKLEQKARERLEDERAKELSEPEKETAVKK